jgi:hypothetical protein
MVDKNENISTDETNVENLLSLIKEQAKEIKINKKKLERLEEKFIKINADFKNVYTDKTNIENFLRNIFPKEMHENIFKTEYGLYDTGELSKMWLICESKNQNEFQQILGKYKNENSDISERNKILMKELDSKTNELNNIKKSNSVNSEQMNFYMNNYNDLNKKVENLESEKNYLMKVIDEKNAEIENLISLEVENAELKAKSLLENLESSSSSSNLNLTLNNGSSKSKTQTANEFEKSQSNEFACGRPAVINPSEAKIKICN